MKKMALALSALMSIAAITLAQDRPIAERDGAAAVRTGAALFRERCTECHGPDAKGVTGHDLTRLWTSGASEERVFQTIRQGVPNSIMPSSSAPDEEVRALVSYLRSLNLAGSTDVATGQAANGERIFWSQCGSCHAINGRGGPVGPNLSLTTQGQSRDSLTRAIRDPRASIPAGYQPVTLVTRDGRRIRAIRKSEDAFSIQIMDTGGHLRGYLKADLREVVRETTPVMPAFGPDRLSNEELADVLAFLSTSRTPNHP